jgi:hypothetical protein
MTAAMFGIDLTTFALGRALSSLSIVMAAIREMTILSAVNCEISPRTCLASPAFTAIRMRSAFFAASLLSEVTTTFADREGFIVETSLLVIITLVACLDLAIELATASPILPAPITAIINAWTWVEFRVINFPQRRWERESPHLSKRKSRRNPTRSRTWYYVVGVIALVAVIGYFLVSAPPQSPAGQTFSSTHSTSLSATDTAPKPVILYVNQGNGVVNVSSFPGLLQVASSHGFNTIFFQVYRSGSVLFTDSAVTQFVSLAHAQGLKIFFALYFTNSSQTIPSSIYADGEDGINLDMSTLPIATQTSLLESLSSAYHGQTAITTTDPSLPLSPSLLIVETYGAGNDQYIHHGMIASVGVFATSSRQDYQQQFQYALANSDGVMVFDYAGLVKAGFCRC